jgi:hypothetical protein
LLRGKIGVEVSKSAAKFKLSFALPALTALVLAGCAVVGSAPTFDEAAVPLGCQSTLGSYSLPKTVLHFVITKIPSDPFHVLQVIEARRVPDNQHTFCLDHLRSALASDEVRVFKNKITTTKETDTDKSTGPELPKKRAVTSVSPSSTPFLQLIASKAVDHTAGIIRRVIRAAFILITNKGSFNPGRSAVRTSTEADGVVVADFEVDPFDYQEMALVNEAVRSFGFCFVLEDFTFNVSRSTGVNPDIYCRAPHKVARQKPPLAAEAIRNLHFLVPRPRDGIFFRPRASYRLSIYTKDDPDGRGTWRLGQIKNFSMENIMPIVSVGVSRAIFATRRTGLVFDDGTLTNVCISKGSEVEGGIQIPLDVIYGIISLPSEMILAATNDASTQKQLLDAQKKLVDAQNTYVKFLRKEVEATAVTGSTATDNKGKLVLGSTAPTTGEKAVTFTNDVPPDADPIYSESNGDALSEICAELMLAKTTNLSPTSVKSEGNF